MSDKNGLQEIKVEDLKVNPLHIFNSQWMVLTCGNHRINRHNCMTVAWGWLGTMWHKPTAGVVIRPQRHTLTYMQAFPTFTLCGFPDTFRPALQLIGSKSGRGGLDKAAMAGLTPIPGQRVEAPAYAEADIIIECRQIYRQDIDPAGFQSQEIANSYPDQDYHRLYLGEIVGIFADSSYKV